MTYPRRKTVFAWLPVRISVVRDGVVIQRDRKVWLRRVVRVESRFDGWYELPPNAPALPPGGANGGQQ